jgi:hypothetical protein
MKAKDLIIVLGLDEKQKPHAAKFDLAQAEIVRKAARTMGFRTAIPKSDDAMALADRLPPGKLFATGKGLVPFCPASSYAKLTAAVDLDPEAKGAPESSKPAAAPSPAAATAKASPAPANTAGIDPWGDLKVGDKVIAPEKRPAEEGWWPCVITAVSKDGRTLTLRWLDNPKQPPVTLKRRAVALLSNG